MSVAFNGVTGSVIGTLPAGMVAYFANSTTPQGWFQCDGTAVSRVNYVDLFNTIGTLYGEGDGSTTFNIPDLRGQFIRVWAGNTSTAATFQGTINNAASTPATGTVLTVTTQPTGRLLIGQVLSGTNVTANTKIIAQVSGTTGGIGVYTVDTSSLAASTTITASVPDAGRVIGSNQVDLFKSHDHGLNHAGNPNLYQNPPNAAYINAANGNTVTYSFLNGGIETRPINAALMICIKY